MKKKRRRKRKKERLKHILIETTGLSGATGSFLDSNLKKYFFLNKIVTVVDSKNLERLFAGKLPEIIKDYRETGEEKGKEKGEENEKEAEKENEKKEKEEEERGGKKKSEIYEQICVADVVLMNKMDLVNEQDLPNLMQMIR